MFFFNFNILYTVLILISKISFGLLIGISLYFAIIKGYLGVKIQNYYLSTSDFKKNKGTVARLRHNKFYFYLVCIIMSFYILLSLIDFVCMNILEIGAELPQTKLNYPGILSASKDSSSIITSTGDVSNTANVSVNITKEAAEIAVKGIANGSIMTAAVFGGLKMAAKLPSVTGKIVTTAATLGVGAAAIVLKDKAGEIASSSNAGSADQTNFFLGGNPDLWSKALLETTGNTSMDIMLILQFLHKIQIYLLLLLGFYSLIKYFKPKLLAYLTETTDSPLANGDKLPSSTAQLKPYIALFLRQALQY